MEGVRGSIPLSSTFRSFAVPRRVLGFVVLGTTKTSGAEGAHHLAPVAIAQLRARRVAQAAERLAAGAAWQTHTYDGQPVSLVFTTATGGLVNRQAVTKAIARAAEIAGLDPQGSPPTPAGERSSPPSTPTEASTSPTSPATSAIPTRAQRQDVSATWERDPSTPPAAPPNCSAPASPADNDGSEAPFDYDMGRIIRRRRPVNSVGAEQQSASWVARDVGLCALSRVGVVPPPTSGACHLVMRGRLASNGKL
jgi:hypothetical protein